MTTSQIASITQGVHLGDDVQVGGFSIDSRTIQKGQAFVALRGNVHDGHDFVMDAIKGGATAVLCERALDLPSDFPQVVVRDSLEALRKLARWKRENFKGTVVAIAGSAGKTTTKEMTAFLLSRVGAVCKTPRNFNSQIGVPLSVVNFEDEADYWVVEMGASQKGDVKRLVELVKPHVRAITAIGEEHLETFGCLDDVVLGNGEVFSYMGEDDWGICPNYVSHCYSVDKKIVFGAGELKAEKLSLNSEGVSFEVCGLDVFIPIPSLAVVENALCSFAILKALGLDWRELSKHLREFSPVEGRFRVIRRESIIIVDDTYNANPPSVKKALQTLSMMDGYKVAVLGDMLEMGESSEIYHKEVGRLCVELGIDLCLFYGPMMKHAYEECRLKGGKCLHFNLKEEVLKFLLDGKPLIGSVILFKGSRGMRMDELVGGLEEWLT